MRLKIAIFIALFLGTFSLSESRKFRQSNKFSKRKMMQKVNGVKFFLKRFCDKEDYKLSSICQTFFKCNCGDDKDGLFECFAKECLPNQDGADSFFCESVKCKTAVESNETEDDDCTLEACDKYNQTLDVGEAAICNKIKFWKAMKECKSKGKRRTSSRDACVDQICTDPNFKEECDRRVFWKNIKECHKNHRGRGRKEQREECKERVCESDDAHEKACDRMAFWKQVKDCRKKNLTDSKDCISDLCQEESCDNQFCKLLNKSNGGNMECEDECSQQ